MEKKRLAAKRIAAIVLNSVSHDARVLKEADSLAAAGYEITIFGIQDNRCFEPETARSSGARIVRVAWKPRAHMVAARVILMAGLLFTALVFGALLLVRENIHAILRVRELVEAVAIAGVASLGLFFVWASIREGRRAAQAGDAASRQSGAKKIDRSLRARLSKVKSILTGKFKHAIVQRAMCRALADAACGFRPDAVHCHDLNAAPAGILCKKRIGCPMVFDSHELYEEQSMASPMQRRVYRRRQRRCARATDAFVTINDSIARVLRERYPRLPEPIIVKNATLPPEGLPRDDGRLHRAAKLEPGTRILLYQGGFALHRGLDVLVRAAALLPEEWCLVMMGWGRFEAELKELAKNVDPRGRKIRFVPPAPQAELGAWTAGGSLGVIPYENVCLNHWYCTPNKLWEYPVAGVPILASPFPELSKAVLDNEIGLLIDDPPTPQAIAGAVSSLTPDRLEQLRRNCQAYIARDNWLVYERRLVGLYDGLLGGSLARAAGGASGVPGSPGSPPPEPKIVAASSTLQSVR